MKKTPKSTVLVISKTKQAPKQPTVPHKNTNDMCGNIAFTVNYPSGAALWPQSHLNEAQQRNNMNIQTDVRRSVKGAEHNIT